MAIFGSGGIECVKAVGPVKKLEKKKPVVTDEGSRIASTSVSDVTASKKEKPKEPPKPTALGSLWDRLQKTADSEFHSTRQLENNAANRDDKKKKKRS